jgi:hypothetical protein
MLRLSKHLLLCTRGASIRSAPLPVVTVSKYLNGPGMRTRRHLTQLAQAIALSLCGYCTHPHLWVAIRGTQTGRDWGSVVLLLDDVPTIDWGNLILIDYSDRPEWGRPLTTLVIRELQVLAKV